MVALVHWGVTYFLCFCLIGAIMLSQMLLTPHLLSLRVPISEGSVTVDFNTTELTRSASTNVTTPIEVGGVGLTAIVPDSKVFIVDSKPFEWTNPFLFELLTHASMVLVLPLYYGISSLRHCSGLPRLMTMRRRLKTGPSKFGRVVAQLHEEFDDHMIEGRISSASPPAAFFVLGLVTTALVLSSYLWRISVLTASVPYCTLLSFSYLLFVPGLMATIFKEKLHGLRLLAAVICFIGMYIFLFPAAPSMGAGSYTAIDILRGTALALSSALLFSLYLLYYRLLNPDGWMLKVMGYQGLGLLVFGTGIVAGLHFSGIERFGIPSSSYEIKTILYTSFFRICILYLLNGSLRWGEPLAVGTALAVAPSASYAFRALFNSSSFPLTWSKIASLVFCLVGLGLVAIYHLAHAIRGQYMLSNRTSSDYRTVGSSQERKRLVVGNDYVI